MNISFCGAARTSTSNEHLIGFVKDKHVLLNCEMFQGYGQSYQIKFMYAEFNRVDIPAKRETFYS